MASTGNPLSPATGAPQIGPPSPANYQSPGMQQLQTEIQNLQSQPDITVDQTGFNQIQSQQQGYLSYLQGIASGTASTQAQQQGQQMQQLADAQAQGRGSAFQGPQAVEGARVANQQQVAMDASIQTQVAQVSAQQRQQAAGDAQNVAAQMQQEQLQMNTQIMQAQQANAVRHSQLINDEVSLSGMQSHAQQSYASALYAYQEQAKQQAIQAKASQNAALFHYVVGGAMAVAGAAALIFGGWTGIGGVAGGGLILGGAEQIMTGVQDQRSGASN